ncbi:MAG: NupC/NupG family nucleoside CNT transporter, partial [Candidatus Marinimicrobia bacterium]|nr:NupC/NupG family nucleoside CNT transporter [Candidatus Neomarinimicrobiota bacterium]
MERLIGFIGMAVLLGLAYAMSNNRKAIDWRLVGWGLALQMIFAIFILKTPI